MAELHDSVQDALEKAKTLLAETDWTLVFSKNDVITEKNISTDIINLRHKVLLKNKYNGRLLRAVWNVNEWDKTIEKYEVISTFDLSTGKARICRQVNNINGELFETVYIQSLIRTDNTIWVIINSIQEEGFNENYKRAEIIVSVFKLEQDGPDCLYSRVLSTKLENNPDALYEDIFGAHTIDDIVNLAY